MQNIDKQKAEALEELQGFIFSDGAGPVCGWVNKHRKTIEAALTPESEGIAGKGEEQDVDHWHLDALKKAYQDTWNMYRDMDYSSTECHLEALLAVGKAALARPQEIDVEQLEAALNEWILKNKGYRAGPFMKDAAEFIASSGYLSAPSREKELMAVIADLDSDLQCVLDSRDCSKSQMKHAAIIAQAQK